MRYGAKVGDLPSLAAITSLQRHKLSVRVVACLIRPKIHVGISASLSVLCRRLMEYFELPESIKAGVAVAQAFFELRRVLTTGPSRQEDDGVDVLVEKNVRSMSEYV